MKISLKIVETGLRPVSTLFLVRPIFTLFLATMLFMSCSRSHLITNNEYRAITEKAFSQKKLLAVRRDSALFTVFRQNISVEQAEALKFLYAFMPLSDLADYNGDFFLANADKSLLARKESAWGKEIPEEIFLHYVLPIRVNNENLDSFRIAYYQELMNRIKGKDLEEAALEINHWCHEKVSYQAADIRTSAPMSTILSARGRCGEESTFTVAALRTVGIPARQVYTPRWAHTDDNHAWVEIWSKGGWHYMGACEPEPVLDRGWFTEPARRAMLVHTKSFGPFTGNENIINRFDDYTDVNNLGKYAITKKIFVKVTDRNNAPVKDAMVEYQLYNYAEFYPLAVVPTNEYGISQFETGLGDLLIWAHKGDQYDFKKISVAETDTLVLKISPKEPGQGNVDLDLNVPVVRSPLPDPSQVLIDQNSARINQENIVRQKYINSWMHASGAQALALKLKIDTARVRNIVARSMGNYKEISSFLTATPDSLLPYALSLLEILPDKDLRDTRENVFSDQIENIDFHTEFERKFFLDNVINPRVANELLVPWRRYFRTILTSLLVQNASHDPSIIIRYLNDSIRIDDDENYYQTPLTPVGVNTLKVTDRASRAICFVAICRSLGIPSRLEPGSNVPQYFINNKWTDVYFSDQKQPDLKKGFIKLQSNDTRPVPEYYIHFTLARFDDGRYNTLEYDYNRKISNFKDELQLSPGHYMLVTGNRLSDSRILSNISFFDLLENEHKTVDVKIRKEVTAKKILGKIDLNKINSLYPVSKTSQACSPDKGMVILWIDPEKEPTKHIFNDLPDLKPEFDRWGGKFVFLSDAPDFEKAGAKGMPVNTFFGRDDKLTVLKNNLKFNSSTEINLPVVVVTDKDGNILFLSTGYRIGIGEEILKYIM